MLRTSVMEWMENGLVRLDQTASDTQSTMERVTESGGELLKETGVRLYELGTNLGTELFTLLKMYDFQDR